MNKVLNDFFRITVFLFICLSTMAVDQAVAGLDDVDKFRLRVYEATIKQDQSLCEQDEYCLDHMRYYRSLVCIDEVCNSKDKSKRSVDCAPAFAALYSPEIQVKVSGALCSLINYPGAATRAAYLSLVVDETEGEAVELGGYLMALKGSAALCQEYIRQYVGVWGPAWNFQWVRALSGCRILAKERTRAEEEKDLNIWLGAAPGAGHCLDIVNSDMREACSATGAKPPNPAYEQLW